MHNFDVTRKTLLSAQPKFQDASKIYRSRPLSTPLLYNSLIVSQCNLLPFQPPFLTNNRIINCNRNAILRMNHTYVILHPFCSIVPSPSFQQGSQSMNSLHLPLRPPPSLALYHSISTCIYSVYYPCSCRNLPALIPFRAIVTEKEGTYSQHPPTFSNQPMASY